MNEDFIVIRGARQHNLKNIDLNIPRDQLIVITGVSGSGKSSLAFDTIYAEGQRRFVESLSTYARQFLGQMDKPDVDYIEGLSPAIAIEQKISNINPRSTVGTLTEIYDYLRLVFAYIGQPHCPQCGKPIATQTIQQMVGQILELKTGSRVLVLAPMVEEKKGQHKTLLKKALSDGFIRARIDGKVFALEEETIDLKKTQKHTIELVVDRLVIGEDVQQRLTEALETALGLNSGNAVVCILGEKESKDIRFTEQSACPDCRVNIGQLEPRMFSFNNPLGACQMCGGMGEAIVGDPNKFVKNWDLSIREGGYLGYNRKPGTSSWTYYESIGKVYGFTPDTLLRDIPKEGLNVLMYGSGGKKLKIGETWREVKGTASSLLENYYRYLRSNSKSNRERAKQYEEQWFTKSLCPTCHGRRLRPEILGVTIEGKNIIQVTEMSIIQVIQFFQELKLTSQEKQIAQDALDEIMKRLNFLREVGLSYLTLNRITGTLSGGEAQRIRLATQIGSYLEDVLYILDEPSIGLHHRDKARLIKTLLTLKDLGNTIIVVEHDEDIIRTADYIIDLGPEAGDRGGNIVVSGSLPEVLACRGSITGQYLNGERSIPLPQQRRKPNNEALIIEGASQHNLKDITVKIPLGLFICITGVSGSGKSTLVNEILHKTLAKELHRAEQEPGRHKEIKGIEYLDKVIIIDQSPIGRSPRSNPATYTGVFDHIRALFTKTSEARARGYKEGRFSFNLKGGRCEKCEGAGQVKIDMQFLTDIYIICDECGGKRFNRETLEILYKEKNIYNVLEMTIEEAISFFSNIPKIKTILQTLYDVGLGYMKLGQPATTLSGGEAQRVKLAKELSRPATGKTLYILDEPTTGLHFADIQYLLDVLRRLVDQKNTVLVIEHNLDVIKTADYIIDLGPEGGEEGGEIIAEGSPEEIVQTRKSYTGQALAPYLQKH